MMAVLLYSKRGGVLNQLELQFQREEIPVLSLTIPKFGWKARLLAWMDISSRYPDEFLMFIDPWDTLFLGTKEELLGLRHIWEHGVTFAAEKHCWPDKSRAPEYDAFQTDPGPWRYLNSAPLVGWGKDIFEAINYGWERFPLATNTNIVEAYDVDERFLTNLYLSEAREKYNIKIDNRCELNQIFLDSWPDQLYLHGGRIYNCVWGTKPIFFHANGKTQIPPDLVEDV